MAFPLPAEQEVFPKGWDRGTSFVLGLFKGPALGLECCPDLHAFRRL